MDEDRTYEVTIRRDDREQRILVRSNCIENAIDKATTPTLDELFEDRAPELVGAPDRDLERAAERFADTVHADVSAQVKLAWALERDRLYAELAELRDEVHAWGSRTRDLEKYVETLQDFAIKAHADLHSVKVPEYTGRDENLEP